MKDVYEQAVNDAAERMARDMDDDLLMSLLGWNKIDVSDGTVYGARYHTARPMWDPDKMPTGYFNSGWNDMLEWCVETFGPTASIWGEQGAPPVNHRWYANNSKFWFRDERDLALFILRWS
jgi:hypothetical protein